MDWFKKDWFENPTKLNLIVLISIWVVGIVFMVPAMTDFFKGSFFNRKYLMMYFLIIASTFTILKHLNSFLAKENIQS
jgi:hypothetical protein